MPSPASSQARSSAFSKSRSAAQYVTRPYPSNVLPDRSAREVPPPDPAKYGLTLSSHPPANNSGTSAAAQNPLRTRAASRAGFPQTVDLRLLVMRNPFVAFGSDCQFSAPHAKLERISLLYLPFRGAGGARRKMNGYGRKRRAGRENQPGYGAAEPIAWIVARSMGPGYRV